LVAEGFAEQAEYEKKMKTIDDDRQRLAEIAKARLGKTPEPQDAAINKEMEEVIRQQKAADAAHAVMVKTGSEKMNHFVQSSVLAQSERVSRQEVQRARFNVQRNPNDPDHKSILRRHKDDASRHQIDSLTSLTKADFNEGVGATPNPRKSLARDYARAERLADQEAAIKSKGGPRFPGHEVGYQTEDDMRNARTKTDMARSVVIAREAAIGAQDAWVKNGDHQAGELFQKNAFKAMRLKAQMSDSEASTASENSDMGERVGGPGPEERRRRKSEGMLRQREAIDQARSNAHSAWALRRAQRAKLDDTLNAASR
jgi:hypothetical protein